MHINVNHTVDLILACGFESEHVIAFPRNSVLSQHYLITFEFLLMDYKPLGKSFFYSRCLSMKVLKI